MEGNKKGSQFLGYKRYIDEDTGEVLEVPQVHHSVSSNKDFDMIFYGHLMNVLDDLGNKKILVLKYLVEKRDKYNNTVLKTIREISKDTGISLPTIHNVLMILEDKGAIKRKTGVIVLNSNLICDGRFKGKIMHIYNSMEEETAEQRAARIQREIKRKEAELIRLQSLRESINTQPSNQLTLV